MYPNYVYQTYQAERPRTRAEHIAEDARRGRQSARASRACRGCIRRIRASISTITCLAHRPMWTALSGS